jgi:hypothetical protein
MNFHTFVLALVAAGLLVAGILVSTVYCQLAAVNKTADQFEKEFTAGINKGHEDRRACEAAGIDTEECVKGAVTCPTNYNVTQCKAYQNGYDTVFLIDKAFSEFYEGLGKGVFGQ